jgi:tRNA A-37 threonylcarbamoyl transferase component Bud32
MDIQKLKWKLYSDLGTTARIYKAQYRFNFYIKKEYRPEIKQIYFDMECRAIQMLQNKNHFTKFVEIDKTNRIIYMDYLGKTLCKQNCPQNWKEQVEEILEILKGLDLYISDFQRNNICISGNQINLIDFGIVNFNRFNYQYLKSCLTFVFENLCD